MFIYIYVYIYIYLHHMYIYMYIYLPVVPHKAVAEVSRIGNVYERLIAVSDGCQSKNIDQLTN